MTNPLLKPNDPRFHQPELRDAEGKSRFAEGESAPAAGGGSGNVYSAADVGKGRPFDPRYEVQQRSRWGLLLLLAASGWAGGLLGAVSFTGIFVSGWICPLLGIAPAATAWLLGYEDLKAIAAGAVDQAADANTRLAMWLGLAGLILCLLIVGSMIYRNMQFLPDLF